MENNTSFIKLACASAIVGALALTGCGEKEASNSIVTTPRVIQKTVAARPAPIRPVQAKVKEVTKVASLKVDTSKDEKAVVKPDHEILMLNKDPNDKKQHMVFRPAFLKVKAGETVLFKSTDKGHNVQSIKGAVPEGGTEWKSRIGKDYLVTFDEEGLYAYKCQPHFAMGMVGVVQVGDDVSNLQALKDMKMPGRSKKRFQSIIQDIK